MTKNDYLISKADKLTTKDSAVGDQDFSISIIQDLIELSSLGENKTKDQWLLQGMVIDVIQEALNKQHQSAALRYINDKAENRLMSGASDD